MVFCPQQPKF